MKTYNINFYNSVTVQLSFPDNTSLDIITEQVSVERDAGYYAGVESSTDFTIEEV